KRYLGLLPAQRLREIMPRYAYRLVLWRPDDYHTLYASPNKMFESIAAGIPPICTPHPQCVEILREFDCGILLDDWLREAVSKALLATGADCLQLARDSGAPEEALFYYSAAEALGADDPELWHERQAVLAQLPEPELAYLNAKYGPWQDDAVIAELADKLQRMDRGHPSIPDTAESLDAIYLVRSGEYDRAIEFAKLIARRDHPPDGLACYLAGISLLQTAG